MVFLFESLSHQVIYSTEIKSLVPNDIWIGVFIAVFSILVVKKQGRRQRNECPSIKKWVNDACYSHILDYVVMIIFKKR